MSLEEALARMTKAVEANTAAILGGKGAKPAATEAAAPAAEKPAPAAAEGGKRGPGRPAKKAGPTLDEVTTAANAFMEANGKPAARALLQEHGSKSGKLADLPEGNYAAVLKAIADASQDEDGEDGEADDDGI
jgi:hypothetical protein